jgi:hypothetical protein
MSTVSDETMLGGVPLENSKKLHLKECKIGGAPLENSTKLHLKECKIVDKISPLTQTQSNLIQDSIGDDKSSPFTRIDVPLENSKEYTVIKNVYGNLVACKKHTLPDGTSVDVHDINILVTGEDNNYILCRTYFYQTISDEELEKQEKEKIGNIIFSIIQKRTDISEKAGKITGMLLEMNISDLLNLIKDESELNSKITDAIKVLQDAEAIEVLQDAEAIEVLQDAEELITNVNTQVLKKAIKIEKCWNSDSDSDDEDDSSNKLNLIILEAIYDLLPLKYSVNLSEKDIEDFTRATIYLSLIDTSIIKTNGIVNPKYIEQFNKFKEEVSSKIFIPNKNLTRIIEFLDKIECPKIVDESKVWRGNKLTRPVEDLSFLLKFLNLEEEKDKYYPCNKKGHPLKFKLKDPSTNLSVNNPVFPYRKYAEDLKKLILANLNNEAILTSMGLIVSLYDQIGDFQAFLDK